jgi:hypothetical protein
MFSHKWLEQRDHSMELLQDRLDVKNKTRANLFDWRGQFTPQFADYMLENFAQNDDVVVDPFSGSGTVLLECARKNMTCYGYEINPAAYVMSKFYSFCNIAVEARERIASAFQDKVVTLVSRYEHLPIFMQRDSFRESHKSLLGLAEELFSRTDNPTERVLAINTLFTAEGYKNGTVESSIYKALRYIIGCLMALPYTSRPVSAGLIDARLLDKYCPTAVNVILTSPPYINVLNYHQNHRAILEVIGLNLLEIAQSEIGSNRKHRGNRFKTVVQYCIDMEDTMNSLWKCLRDTGLIVFVIGKESSVRRTAFHNGEIVKEIAQGIGGFGDIQNFTRTFVNKFGINIKEDIIVLRKTPMPPKRSIARDVALRHLESSLQTAPETAKGDLLDVIKHIDMVHASPLLTVKEDFLYAKDSS